MSVGVFIPIGNNGWLLSENAPQYRPSFALNKQITLKAEGYGLDFALSMIKLRGFGGKTEFWDHNLESFTLMAGLAAVTTRIKLFATAATLCLPPAIVARMAATIDSISDGRFGVNLVTGWQKPEYDQMGLWPGDAYFAKRYDYLAEYAQILRELWETGVSDRKGTFFQMNDCRLSPRPQAPMKIICAGQSGAGLAFTARYADYNFCLGKGLNTPTAFAPVVETLAEARAKTGRRVTCYALFMIIADETDDAALATWEHLPGGRRRRGDRVARPPGRGRHQVRRRYQRAPARRPDLGGEPQHGHPGGQLRQRGRDARRDRDHRRGGGRAAGVRRLPQGSRRLRDADPAADAHAPARHRGAARRGRLMDAPAGFRDPQGRHGDVVLPARPEPIALDPADDGADRRGRPERLCEPGRLPRPRGVRRVGRPGR